MRNLLEYISESLGKGELLDYIKQHLDSVDLIQARRMYSIINDNPNMRLFEDKLKELGLEAVSDNIYNYFDKYGQGETLVNYVIQPEDKKISAAQLLSNPDGNIIDLVSDFAHITKSPIKRLAKETTTGGVKVGEFEFVLRLFMQNINIKDKRGDIVSSNIPIELKCGSARLNGSGTDYASTIRESVNETLRNAGYDMLVDVKEFNGKGGRSVSPNFFEKMYNIALQKDKNTAKDFIVHMFIDAYTSQYKGVRDNNNTRNELYKVAADVLFNGNKLNKDAVLPCIAATTLVMYQLLEGFGYIVIIDKNSGSFHSVDFSNVNSKYIENVIYRMFADGSVKIISIQNEEDKMYGKGVQIEYGK